MIRITTQTVPAPIKGARIHSTTYVEVTIAYGARRISLDLQLKYRLSVAKLSKKTPKPRKDDWVKSLC